MAEISDRPITPAQIRAIHVALPRRGLSDDDYRGILRERLRRRDLQGADAPAGSRPAARTGPGAAAAARGAHAAATGAIRMATPAQRELIDELAGEIA